MSGKVKIAGVLLPTPKTGLTFADRMTKRPGRLLSQLYVCRGMREKITARLLHICRLPAEEMLLLTGEYTNQNQDMLCKSRGDTRF